MNNITAQKLFHKFLSRFDRSPALTFLPGEETLTYGEMSEKVDAIAGYLYRLGVRPGTHVSLLLPNSIEFLLFSFAAGKCGAATSSLNDMLNVREVDFVLKDFEPEVIILATERQVPIVYNYTKEIDRKVTVVGVRGFGINYPGEFKLFDWNDALSVRDLPAASPDDLARVSYTGGTTGTPKGVMHSQYSVGASLIAHAMENSAGDLDRMLLSTPLQHAAGPNLTTALSVGAHVYFTRTFDPEEFLNIIKDKKITTTMLVPTMLYRVLDQGKKMNIQIDSVTNISYGASPVSPKRLKEAFEMFGPVLRQGYGLTECPNLVTRLSKGDHVWAYHNNQSVLRSAGKPCMMADVKLVDNNGNEAQRGEIIVQAPYNMAGYFKRPDLTREALRDGWLHTGDIGEWDEFGFLHIVERKKDMIISGGMNVYSIEVENAANQHPAVAMSACIGVPHDDWGEAVCVYAVLKKGYSCTEEDLIGFCKGRIAKYMVPKIINFVDSLPLTPIGKIDKKEIRKAFWEGKDRQIN